MTPSGPGCSSHTCCADLKGWSVPIVDIGGPPPQTPRHIWQKKKIRPRHSRKVIDRSGRLPYATPRAEGRMAAPFRGGKSGLPEATVPGNARAGQPDGQRHREQTAPVSTGVRVKRWGKSPPGGWQQSPHGKPHREQCRIGIARGDPVGQPIPPAGMSCTGDPGWQLE